MVIHDARSPKVFLGVDRVEKELRRTVRVGPHRLGKEMNVPDRTGTHAHDVVLGGFEKSGKVRVALHSVITIILGHGALSQTRPDVTGKMPLIHVVSLVVLVQHGAIVAALCDGTRLGVQTRPEVVRFRQTGVDKFAQRVANVGTKINKDVVMC